MPGVEPGNLHLHQHQGVEWSTALVAAGPDIQGLLMVGYQTAGRSLSYERFPNFRW